MKKIKITVCVVTYNQERYIEECLNSLVSQVVDCNYEILVSDDCSTDRTREILLDYCNKYPELIRLHIHDKNIGAYQNFKFCHNHAIGEFVAHLDGDDLALPGKLQKQSSFLDCNKEYTVVWHRMNLFDDLGGFYCGINADYSMFRNGIIDFKKSLRIGSVASHSSIMYRRATRKSIVPNFDALDLFYTWGYLSQGLGKILDETLGGYRVGSSGSISKFSELKLRRLNADHAGYYLNKFPEVKSDIFIFAISNLIIDLKNLRKSALYFLILSINSFCIINPWRILQNLLEMNKLRVPELER
jgi:glycosyltransferase involved in cell wall biosynthesis